MMKKLTNDAVAEAKIKFEDEDIEAAKQLLLVDLWDTYDHMKNNKWVEGCGYTKEQYLEHTNIAITAIHFYADGALACVRRNKCWSTNKFKKVKRKINSMRLLTIDEI